MILDISMGFYCLIESNRRKRKSWLNTYPQSAFTFMRVIGRLNINAYACTLDICICYVVYLIFNDVIKRMELFVQLMFITRVNILIFNSFSNFMSLYFLRVSTTTVVVIRKTYTK